MCWWKHFPLKEVVLAFSVTLKVFKSCLGVLHVMWGTWCMDEPLIIL